MGRRARPPGRWRPSPRTRKPAEEGAAGRRPGLLGSDTAARLAVAAGLRRSSRFPFSPFSNNKQEVRHAAAARRRHFRPALTPRMRPAPAPSAPAFPKVLRGPGRGGQRACAVGAPSPPPDGGSGRVPSVGLRGRRVSPGPKGWAADPPFAWAPGEPGGPWVLFFPLEIRDRILRSRFLCKPSLCYAPSS